MNHTMLDEVGHVFESKREGFPVFGPKETH